MPRKLTPEQRAELEEFSAQIDAEDAADAAEDASPMPEGWEEAPLNAPDGFADLGAAPRGLAALLADDDYHDEDEDEEEDPA